jgi:hypothetical protein
VARQHHPGACSTLAGYRRYIDTYAVTGLTSNPSMPDATLQAFHDHSEVGEPMPADGGDSDAILARFRRAGIDPAEVAEAWRRGSVIGSWLLDLTAEALLADPHLEQLAGRVADSGEGRWTSIAAIEEGVPATLLTAALYSRFASRGGAVFADKVQSAQRLEFGGHAERKGSA